MKWLSNFLNTSVGRKQLMALSGLGLTVFLVIHLSGNFLLFAGDGGEKFNAYAEFLAGQFWINGARAGLLLTLIIHMALAFQLSGQNRAARKTDYYFKADSGATMASRSMLLTGILIFGFVIIHLMNFTWADKNVPGGLYGLVIGHFQNPFWALFYMFMMVVLGTHLVHAIQSVFTTFGLRHAKYTPIIKTVCMLLAVGLSLGFFSIPLFFFVFQGGM
jgi:succinate dehydrogenase / fumarate reductase cytochrome b subunit